MGMIWVGVGVGMGCDAFCDSRPCSGGGIDIERPEPRSREGLLGVVGVSGVRFRVLRGLSCGTPASASPRGWGVSDGSSEVIKIKYPITELMSNCLSHEQLHIELILDWHTDNQNNLRHQNRSSIA